MKKHQLLLVLLLILACGSPPPEETAMPDDLPGLRALLEQKKSDLRVLEGEINNLETVIAEKDPASVEITKFVSIDTLQPQDFKHFVTVQGSVMADDLLSASSESGGRITSLKVDEGDYVKQGQLIAETDLESVDKQIAELQKSLELAIDVFERQERLWNQKIGSEVQYLQAKNNKERLEASIETLEFQRTKSNVYAPISGVVDMVLQKEGEMTSPGMPIVQILNTSRLKVEADVPENLLPSIRVGDQVKVFLPALNEEMTRRVTQIGRRIDPSNRTFRIEVSIPSRGIIKPNLLAELELNDFSEQDVIVISQELVQQEISGKDYVMILAQDENGHFATKHYVTIGESSEGMVVITEGLNTGQPIIVRGGRGLTDGERVKLAESQES